MKTEPVEIHTVAFGAGTGCVGATVTPFGDVLIGFPEAANKSSELDYSRDNYFGFLTCPWWLYCSCCDHGSGDARNCWSWHLMMQERKQRHTICELWITEQHY